MHSRCHEVPLFTGSCFWAGTERSGLSCTCALSGTCLTFTAQNSVPVYHLGGWCYKILTFDMCILGPGTIPRLSAGWDEAWGLSAPSLHTALCLWKQSGRDASATIWTQTTGKEGRGSWALLVSWRYAVWGPSEVGWQEEKQHRSAEGTAKELVR